MMQERIARSALLAYPASARDMRAEMLGTVLDAGESSHARFGYEIVVLVWSGWRARLSQRTDVGALRLLADGLCLAGVWMLTLIFAGDVGDRVRGLRPGDPEHPSWLTLSLIVLALSLALAGRDRPAGAAALLFSTIIVLGPDRYDLGDRWRNALLVPIACFLTLVLIPRRRRPGPHGLAWLGFIVGVAFASSLSTDSTAAILLVGLASLAPLSLLLIPVDPRPAIACAVCVCFFGVAMTQDQGGPGLLGLMFLAATPAVLTLVAVRARYVHQR